MLGKFRICIIGFNRLELFIKSDVKGPTSLAHVLEPRGWALKRSGLTCVSAAWQNILAIQSAVSWVAPGDRQSKNDLVRTPRSWYKILLDCIKKQLCFRVFHSQTPKGDKKAFKLCVISGVCRKGDESCAMLGYYAAGGGNSLATFQSHLQGSRIHLQMDRQVVPKGQYGITTTRCVRLDLC